MTVTSSCCIAWPLWQYTLRSSLSVTCSAWCWRFLPYWGYIWEWLILSLIVCSSRFMGKRWVGWLVCDLGTRFPWFGTKSLRLLLRYTICMSGTYTGQQVIHFLLFWYPRITIQDKAKILHITLFSLLVQYEILTSLFQLLYLFPFFLGCAKVAG